MAPEIPSLLHPRHEKAFSHWNSPSFATCSASFTLSLLPSPLQFDDLSGFCPETGIQGYSPQEVLRHLITKHKGNRDRISVDIERWTTGALDLDVWEPAAPRSKVSPGLRCSCGGVVERSTSRFLCCLARPHPFFLLSLRPFCLFCPCSPPPPLPLQLLLVRLLQAVAVVSPALVLVPLAAARLLLVAVSPREPPVAATPPALEQPVALVPPPEQRLVRHRRPLAPLGARAVQRVPREQPRPPLPLPLPLLMLLLLLPKQQQPPPLRRASAPLALRLPLRPPASLPVVAVVRAQPPLQPPATPPPRAGRCGPSLCRPP